MELNLRGRTALVTGGTKGIGLAIARTLAAEGMSVVAGARTAADISVDTGGVTVLTADLATADGPPTSSGRRSTCSAASTCS